jgi:hypothetical protein
VAKRSVRCSGQEKTKQSFLKYYRRCTPPQLPAGNCTQGALGIVWCIQSRQASAASPSSRKINLGCRTLPLPVVRSTTSPSDNFPAYEAAASAGTVQT